MGSNSIGTKLRKAEAREWRAGGPVRPREHGGETIDEDVGTATRDSGDKVEA
jgi:hypothetical protein